MPYKNNNSDQLYWSGGKCFSFCVFLGMLQFSVEVEELVAPEGILAYICKEGSHLLLTMTVSRFPCSRSVVWSQKPRLYKRSLSISGMCIRPSTNRIMAPIWTALKQLHLFQAQTQSQENTWFYCRILHRNKCWKIYVSELRVFCHSQIIFCLQELGIFGTDAYYIALGYLSIT